MKARPHYLLYLIYRKITLLTLSYILILYIEKALPTELLLYIGEDELLAFLYIREYVVFLYMEIVTYLTYYILYIKLTYLFKSDERVIFIHRVKVYFIFYI
jgi:hypothetical protein